MDLRNPRFPYSQHSSDFLHGEFFKIIKRQNLPFTRLELTDGAGQKFAELRIEA
jgi:hypothetical protein